MTIQQFSLIDAAYRAFDKEFRKKHHHAVRDTEKGIWGASSCGVVFALFKKLKLDGKRKFLDIGCGDGRVVAVASLFTDAVGIEIDAELVKEGNSIINKIDLAAKLVCADFFKHDFSQYDVLFINPDTGFYNGLEDKLIKEMSKDVVLLVYNNIFLPRFLKRGKTHWIEQVPVTEFKQIES
jgi:protein-L-isoaspartate O-methyltransferase